MKAFLKYGAIGLVAVAALVLAFVVWGYMPVPPFEPVAYEAETPVHWPTDGWRHSTPEEQGMSSETLVAMMAFYEQSRVEDPELYIDSMTIVRNGHIVAEFYPNPLYPRGEMHVIHSATKSIVSALVGIAVDRGHIPSVDVPVVDLFPDRQIQNLDDRKRRMTIRDLLSMETGLHSRDSYLYAHEGLFQMQHASDWLQFALDLPMAAEPGERFDYSNISTFLLSTIIMKTTGSDTLEFANEHLFRPLGIEDVKWEWNSEGQPVAWARMWLEPDDMAKIGLLYLQQGRWDGEQVIPADWVRQSLTPSAYPPNAVDVLDADMSKNQEASSRNWVGQRFFRPFADGYGYQWWLDRDGYYAALGNGGQYIMVAPEENLVFVVTSKSRGLAQFMPATLFLDFVVPSVRSDAPLAADEAALADLQALASPPAPVERVSAVPDLPAIATQISGATYAMETNPFNTDDIRFVFDPEKNHAELSYTARETWKVDYEIGLDGVRRFTKTNDSVFAAVGRWTSATTFSIDVEIVGYSTFDRWEFTFEGDTIRVTEFSIAGDYSYGGRARYGEVGRAPQPGHSRTSSLNTPVHAFGPAQASSGSDTDSEDEPAGVSFLPSVSQGDSPQRELGGELLATEAILSRMVGEGPRRPRIENPASQLMEEEPPSGPQHTPDLRDRALPVRNVMDDPEVEDRVERLILGVDGRDISDAQLDSIGHETGKPTTRFLHHVRVEVDGSYVRCAELGEDDLGADTSTAADLEHVAPIDRSAQPAEERCLMSTLPTGANRIVHQDLLDSVQLHPPTSFAVLGGWARGHRATRTRVLQLDDPPFSSGVHHLAHGAACRRHCIRQAAAGWPGRDVASDFMSRRELSGAGSGLAIAPGRALPTPPDGDTIRRSRASHEEAHPDPRHRTRSGLSRLRRCLLRADRAGRGRRSPHDRRSWGGIPDSPLGCGPCRSAVARRAIPGPALARAAAGEPAGRTRAGWLDSMPSRSRDPRRCDASGADARLHPEVPPRCGRRPDPDPREGTRHVRPGLRQAGPHPSRPLLAAR